MCRNRTYYTHIVVSVMIIYNLTGGKSNINAKFILNYANILYLVRLSGLINVYK